MPAGWRAVKSDLVKICRIFFRAGVTRYVTVVFFFLFMATSSWKEYLFFVIRTFKTTKFGRDFSTVRLLRTLPDGFLTIYLFPKNVTALKGKAVENLQITMQNLNFFLIFKFLKFELVKKKK